MNITINFNDIDICDWIEYNGEDISKISLKEIFKEEILTKFLEKIDYDREVRKYVKDNLNNALGEKLNYYKNDLIIKSLVKEAIESYVTSNNHVPLNYFKGTISQTVDTYLKDAIKDIPAAIEDSVKRNVENCLQELYKESTLRNFINTEKLTSYIYNKLTEDSLI